MSGHRPWADVRADARHHRGELAERLRAADDRVPVVERAFLAQRLGLVGDDLELLDDDVVTRFLALPASVTLPIAATRLLEHLDAVVARAHPVLLDWPGDGDGFTAVATVPFGDDDDRLRVVLDDGVVAVRREVSPVLAPLSLDDAEALAYALLRLVGLGRVDPGGDLP